MNLCPDCDQPFNGFKCKCGFKSKKPSERKYGKNCAYSNCNNLGVISPFIGSDIPFYCHTHYDLQTGRGSSSKNRNPELGAICGDLLKKRMNGEIGSFELIEQMFDLSKQFPNSGMAETAQKMLNSFQAKP